jgi:hypothetical protein
VAQATKAIRNAERKKQTFDKIKRAKRGTNGASGLEYIIKENYNIK